MKKIFILIIMAIFIATSHYGYTQGKDTSEIIREREIWKGALTGAGVIIIGGALIDAISGEYVEDVERVASMDPREAYRKGYNQGYYNGYKQGYTRGYKDGYKDIASVE